LFDQNFAHFPFQLPNKSTEAEGVSHTTMTAEKLKLQSQKKKAANNPSH